MPPGPWTKRRTSESPPPLAGCARPPRADAARALRLSRPATLGQATCPPEAGARRDAAARVTLSTRRPARHAEPRAPVGDRAGDGAPRLRLLPRGAQAHRPAAGPVGGGEDRGGRERRRRARRAASTCASCSTSSGRRSSSSGSCSRRGPTSSRRTSSPSCAGSRTTCARSRSSEVERVIRGGSRQLARAALPRVRPDAGRGGLDRPGAPRGAPERPRVAVKVQRPGAPRQIEADIALLVPGGAPRAGAGPRARLHRRARSSSTSSPARSARSSTTGSRRATPQALPPQLRRPSARARPARLLELHARPGADARVARRRPARRRRHARARRVEERRAARVPGHRDVDDDDLPARLLPRRPAPGEHPRPRRARHDRPRRLRRSSASSPTTTCRS